MKLFLLCWSVWLTLRASDNYFSVLTKSFLLLLLLPHWNYIPGWHLTTSMSFRHSSLECALILQFLHPTPCDVLLWLVAPPQLWSASSSVATSSWFSTKSLSFHPHHMSRPSKSTKFNQFHIITLITQLIYFRVFLRRTFLSKNLRKSSPLLPIVLDGECRWRTPVFID